MIKVNKKVKCYKYLKIERYLLQLDHEALLVLSSCVDPHFSTKTLYCQQFRHDIWEDRVISHS
jgi:hypothetical protein